MAVKGLVIINKKLGTNYKTIGAALQALELPFMFAGREQWVRNVSGVGVDDTPALHNVSMVNPRYDVRAKGLLIGHIRDSKTAKADVKFWKSLVPAGAGEVLKKLNALGIPFSVELLASPEINLSGEAPLFDGKESPVSLFQLGVLQKGERGYLRSLSWKTLMLEVFPPYYRYFHRGAGQPVPADLVAGLTFGSPVYSQLPDGTWGYIRSPLMSTPSYAAWAKAGMPD